jgi:arsenate reductase
MEEAGVDITDQASTRVTAAMLDWADYVVTVCGHADEHCPVLPAGTRKEHWPLPDPAKATGSEEHVMAVFRESRDDIRRRVLDLIVRLKHPQVD